MIEPYQDTNESSRDRKRKLYRDITHRGPRAFAQLVDTLSEMGYWDIVADLDPDSPFANIRYPNPTNHISKREPKPPRSNENFLSIPKEKEKSRTKLEAELQKNTAQTRAVSPPADDNAEYIPPFTVVKSTKFAEYDGNKNELPHYRTRGRQRGFLVLFSYIDFQSNIADSRKGASLDDDNLKYLFSEMGIKTLKYLNLTKQETLDTLKLMETTLEGCECVFIVVSSHGYARLSGAEYDIRCSDGRLVTDLEILAYFSNTSLPKLRDKPKVIIFQTCRGSKTEYVYTAPTEGVPLERGAGEGPTQTDGTPELPAVTRAQQVRLVPHPQYTDLLIAYSTLPGNVSYRDPSAGSWYIQTLCEVFAARAHDTDVSTLLSLVDQQVRERFGKQTSAVTNWGFNRRLYLHPGLFEHAAN